MKVLIVFSSESGTTQYFVDLLMKRFQELEIDVNKFQIGIDGQQPDLKDQDVVLFGAPTYYDGQLQSDMESMTLGFTGSLEGYKLAVFGLGDSNYPKFAVAADHLEAWIAQHNGKLLVKSLKVDGYPNDFKEYTEWVKEIVAKAKI